MTYKRPGYNRPEHGFCHKREDETHCYCWWDEINTWCCSCEYSGPLNEESNMLQSLWYRFRSWVAKYRRAEVS